MPHRPKSAVLSPAAQEIRRIENIVRARCRANFPQKNWARTLPRCFRGHRASFHMVYGWQDAVAVANAGRVYRLCHAPDGEPKPKCGVAYVYTPPKELARTVRPLLNRRTYLKTIRSRAYKKGLKNGTLPVLAEVPYPWEAMGESHPATSPDAETSFNLVWYHTNDERPLVLACQTKSTSLYSLSDFPTIMNKFGTSARPPCTWYEYLNPRTKEWHGRADFKFFTRAQPGMTYCYRSPGVIRCPGLDTAIAKWRTRTEELLPYASSPESLPSSAPPSSDTESAPSSPIAAKSSRRDAGVRNLAPSQVASSRPRQPSPSVVLVYDSDNASSPPLCPPAPKQPEGRYRLPSPNRKTPPHARPGKKSRKTHRPSLNIAMGDPGSVINPIDVDA